MKKKNLILSVMAVLITAIVAVSCKSTESSIRKEEKIARLKERVESRNYVFTATSATPIGFRAINLTSEYTLEVSPDTIKCRLPYFGRAYVAPLDPNSIGVSFISTDFDYQVKEKKDMWEITIKPNDNDNIQALFLSIGNTGYASLSVQQISRQSISYNGTVE